MKRPDYQPSATYLPQYRRDGFTLVELLIAVLFVATVLALSVPRLFHASSAARSARQQTIFGSVRAAAQITRAAAQVHNELGVSGTVTVDGTRISTVYGYPAASEAGIVAATGLDLASDGVSLNGGGPDVGNTISVALNGARATCTVVYIAPAAPDAQPAVTYVDSDGKGGAGC